MRVTTEENGESLHQWEEYWAKQLLDENSEGTPVPSSFNSRGYSTAPSAFTEETLDTAKHWLVLGGLSSFGGALVALVLLLVRQ